MPTCYGRVSQATQRPRSGLSRVAALTVVSGLIWFGLAGTAAADPRATDAAQMGSEGDIPRHWRPPADLFDYLRRDLLIPMRDGVKLYTVILVPKAARDLPILLDRTPYNAASFVKQPSPKLRDSVTSEEREWVDDGYILAFQDVRGKYGSQGKYVMTRPPIGPLNPTKTDETTDAYDTIEWLVRHVPESNQRVGMIGSSYDGFTAAMALLHPHPALRVVAPESPMIDGWIGDDWFQYGAFRQVNFDYFVRQTSVTGKGDTVARPGYDDYQNFLDAGSAAAYAAGQGLEQLPWWNRLAAHPAYDAFWQQQALDKILAQKPSDIPTLWIEGLWDQEDIYGAVHAWLALAARGKTSNNYLAIGPWYHSQINSKAENLGPLKWNGDTAAQFRRNVLVPFFDTYLKDRPAAAPLPRVQIYDAAQQRWESFSEWPLVKESSLTPLYLTGGGALGLAGGADGEDSYVSDPAKPVPFLPRPLQFGDRPRWQTWLVQDQRFVSSRPDVLVYQTPLLTSAVTVRGMPIADLFIKTDATDADIVVKLIDVYPATDADQPEMGGYELPISMAIFRGRYRHSFSDPSPIPAGEKQEYRFTIPSVNYVFKTGHRIMVQVQSTLFPLYDRNPQTFVPNIFFATKSAYRKATITVLYGKTVPTAVLLPIVQKTPE